MVIDRRSLLAASAALGVMGAPTGAQSFPSKQMTIVVPFAAGGPSDAMARLIALGLTEITGSQVIVENMAGAGGTTGSARVAKAEPDGHTILFGNIGTHAANVGLYKRLPYSPETDFEPIALVANVPFLLAVKKDSLASDFASFRKLATEQGDKLNYGSAGIGSASHLASLLLMAKLGSKATHVPYRGVGPALNDLVAGQIDFMCDQTVTMLPQVQGGAVKPIAVLSRTRLPQLPILPTAIEGGLADFEVEAWNALFAPKGTPRTVVERLFALVWDALNRDSVKPRFGQFSAAVPPRDQAGPAALRAHVASEVKRWTETIRAAGISVD